MTTDEKVRVPVSADPPPTTPPPPREASVGDLFRAVYRFFYSKTVGLLLILAMTVLVLLGVLIGQASAGVYQDPAAKEQFVEQARGKYGGWAAVFDALGLFRVFSSPIFLTVIALLAVSIVACTVHRIPQLWQRYRHPRLHAPDRFFDRARYRAQVDYDGDRDVALTAVRQRLRAGHYRVIADPKAPDTRLYADRYSWGGFGTVVAHASFIVILAAFVVSSASGIDDLAIVPVEGDAVDIGHGTAYSVKATAFDATFDDDGHPLDYVSHLVFYDDGDVVAEQDVRVNEPLRYSGTKLHQSTFGIGADVQIAGPDGATLYRGSVPLQWTSSDGTLSIGKFDVPGYNLEILVLTPKSGVTGASLAAGQASFEVYEIGGGDGQPLTTVTAEQGVPVELGDFEATFEREREYTGILVRNDPGAALMWIGSALLVIGMTITFVCRPRRLWVRIDEEAHAVRVASSDKEDSAFTRQFQSLAFGIASALDEERSTKKEES